MRSRKSFSAICYHFGRDAVRPKRAETTLQIYAFFFISQRFCVFLFHLFPIVKIPPSLVDSSKIFRKSLIFIVIKKFFVLLQPEKRQKTAMYLYKSLIINRLINGGG